MKTLFTLFLFCWQAYAIEVKESNVVDLSSSNIGTGAWVTCLTVTFGATAFDVNNQASIGVRVCDAADSTDCSDSSNTWVLAAGQGISRDRYLMSTKLHLKSLSGTGSTGYISCSAWRVIR